MASGSSNSWRFTSIVAKENKEVQYCETICSFLRMLSCSEKNDAYRALLTMTNSPESCNILRRAGCIPLLIQILYPSGSTPSESQPSTETKLRASKALKNIVLFNPDDKMKRKELRVLKLLESIRSFTISCHQYEPESHPTAGSTALLKLAYDDEHRNIICTFGGVHILADLIISDNKIHGPQPTDIDCLLIRTHTLKSLTSLTLTNGINKALLCSMPEFLTALVSQLNVENEEVVQATVGVVRNLSGHADSTARNSLRDSFAVSALVKVLLRSKKETTIKQILSALWNLSSHSQENKTAICSTPAALKYLLNLMKTYKSDKSGTIVESAGGVLSNVSQYVASKDELREALRDCHCFEILLEQLKSPSLNVVANACTILSHLSGKDEEQQNLIELNAASMLKNLRYSKHEQISAGANNVLRNIMSFCEQTNELRQSYDPITSEQPLDLTMSSFKSIPVRKSNPPPFLNPPIYNGVVSSTRSCPDVIKNQQQQKLEGSSDETFNFSRYDDEGEDDEDDGNRNDNDDEEEKNQQKDTVKTYCDEGTPAFQGSMVDLSNQTMDSFISFTLEDTPAGILSSTSSLSSIGENPHGENRAEKIMTHNKPPVPGLIIGTVSSSSTSNNLVTSSTLKRVTFSAEETPLMFSRCSSVASLESCGDLNNGRESDCVSEFSRRTSEVVSPSELPDSPRAGISILSPNDRNVRQIQPLTENIDDDVAFIETDQLNNKPASSVPTVITHDEIKLFALEGTPFLISTATSLSDIVGELDNSIENLPILLRGQSSVMQEIQEEKSKVSELTTISTSIFPITVDKTEQDTQHQQQEEKYQSVTILVKDGSESQSQSTCTPPDDSKLEDDESIYSDVQLLQKCISAGRAVSLAKKVEIPDEDEEIDLSNLIQRGRAKLITLSESNIQQRTLLPTCINSTPNSMIQSSQNAPKITSDKNDESSKWNFNESEPLHVITAKVSNMNISLNPRAHSILPSNNKFVGNNNKTKFVKICQNFVDELSTATKARKDKKEDKCMQQTHFNIFTDNNTGRENNINRDNEESSTLTSLNRQLSAMDDRLANVTKISLSTPLPPSRFDQDTVVMKSFEQSSPKGKRKNNPERYLTRSIEKSDLKIKPAVPPKPSANGLTIMSSSSSVRPTRASELRANHSRENSPTNSTQSLCTKATPGTKIPPKPPIRSTPTLNTTLPRNTKLMDGHNLSIGPSQSTFASSCSPSCGSTMVTQTVITNDIPGNSTNQKLLLFQQSQQQQQEEGQVPHAMETVKGLGFGTRFGNLLRRSFSKDADKWGKKKDHIWVKRREKVLVSPYNYKPPLNLDYNPTVVSSSNASTPMSSLPIHTPALPSSNAPPPPPPPTTITTANIAKHDNDRSGKSSNKITTV